MLQSILGQVFLLTNFCVLFSYVGARPAHDGYEEVSQTFYKDSYSTTRTIEETLSETFPYLGSRKSTATFTLTISTSTLNPSTLPEITETIEETLTTTVPCSEETQATITYTSPIHGTPQSGSSIHITTTKTPTKKGTTSCSVCSKSAWMTINITTPTLKSSVNPASFSTKPSVSVVSNSLSSSDTVAQTISATGESTLVTKSAYTSKKTSGTDTRIGGGHTTATSEDFSTDSSTITQRIPSTNIVGTNSAASISAASSSTITPATRSTVSIKSSALLGGTISTADSSLATGSASASLGTSIAESDKHSPSATSLGHTVSVTKSLITPSSTSESGFFSKLSVISSRSNSATSDSSGAVVVTSKVDVTPTEASSKAGNTIATHSSFMFGDTSASAGTTDTYKPLSIGQSLATDSSLTNSLTVHLPSSVTGSISQGSVTIITPGSILSKSHISSTYNAPSHVSATTTPVQSLPLVSTSLPINSAKSSIGLSSGVSVAPSLSTQTAVPSISIVVVSGSTATYTPTRVLPDASLTTTIITSTTDAAGAFACIIIFPFSEGWGWAFPFRSDCSALPIPPPPSCPPPGASISGCLSSNSSIAPGQATVTSTMTTIPPGFWTEATTNTLWTGNTWLTTEVDGKSTIVPVLVGCDGCGKDHGGIILWNLPEIPWVLFKFPGFPNLPTFHLPCIKLFGIISIGDCSEPPSTDGSNTDDSSQPSSNHSPPSISRENPSSVSTESHSSTIRTSSSSACSSTLTASDCSIVCHVAPTGTSSTTPVSDSCSTSCYSTSTGCSVTGTTTITTSTMSAVRCSSGSCGNCVTTVNEATMTALPCSDCLPGNGPLAIHQSTSTVALVLSTGSIVLRKRTLATPNDVDGGVRELIENSNKKKETPKLWQRYLYKGGGVNDGSDQTAMSIPFQRKMQEATINGLYGCTGVIVISQKGVWLAHFFEVPSFWKNGGMVDAETFRSDVIETMLNGDDTVDGDGRPLMPGLLKDISPEGLFSPETTTTALIVSAVADGGMPGDPGEFEPLVQIIEEKLQQILPNYKPSKQGTRFAYIRRNSVLAESVNAPHGKVLFQYDPDEVTIDDKGCPSPVAMARVYMMDQETPLLEFTWPDVSQKSKRNAIAGRIGGGCSLTISSSKTASAATSSASSTSTSPAPKTLLTSTTSSTKAAPTSVAPPVTTGSTCNCNEDGCTPDSPACCADGTCGTEIAIRAVLAGPKACDCDENGCTPESPPCCANGTCRI